MTASYLIRLDDAHPQMNIKKWDLIEEICLKYRIKPIVAVIPNCQDKNLSFSPYDENFWLKIRKWQSLGWSIGLHGYQHLLKTSSSGIIGINKYSEFSDLPYNDQYSKIESGYKILKSYGINPTVWVAPAHGMDKNTVKALKSATPIRTISDGLHWKAFSQNSINWIPQQLWRPHKQLFGTWTICLHPSEMPNEDFEKVESFIKKNRRNFISVNDVCFQRRPYFTSIFKVLFLSVLRIRCLVKKINLYKPDISD